MSLQPGPTPSVTTNKISFYVHSKHNHLKTKKIGFPRKPIFDTYTYKTYALGPVCPPKPNDHSQKTGSNNTISPNV